jgi:hypothetical protein
MIRSAEAAKWLREFARRYEAHYRLAEHLEMLGGLVGSAERARAAEQNALAAERVLRESITVKTTELAELSRRLHNAQASKPGRRNVRIR